MSTLSSIAETCVSLRSLGHRVVIVSSGAIGMGLHRMDLPAQVQGKKGQPESRSMGEKQALAAIGQGRLIALWDQIFGALKQPIAQILLTRNDIADVKLSLFFPLNTKKLIVVLFSPSGNIFLAFKIPQCNNDPLYSLVPRSNPHHQRERYHLCIRDPPHQQVRRQRYPLCDRLWNVWSRLPLPPNRRRFSLQ